MTAHTPFIEKSHSEILSREYRYTYALNNPLTFSDPSGYYVESIAASEQTIIDWLSGSYKGAYGKNSRTPYQNAFSGLASSNYAWSNYPDGSYRNIVTWQYLSAGDFNTYMMPSYTFPDHTLSGFSTYSSF
jgi:hypothetical protein